MLSGCNTGSSSIKPTLQAQQMATSGDANGFLIVDCLLPGQVRKLGRASTYITPRRPIKTSVADCEIRGGEYVAYDRTNYATALRVWLSAAKKGNAKAQIYVGEIYEKGLGITTNYEEAARWYQKAADQNYASAQMNLGFLYEKGLGVQQDSALAAKWYRKAAGLPEINFSTSIQDSQELQQLRDEAQILREQLRNTEEQLKNLQLEQGQDVTHLRLELEKTQQKLAEVQAQLRERGLALQVSQNSQAQNHSNKVCRGLLRCQSSHQTEIKKLPLGHYHALIIGNNQYRYLPQLGTAVNDAKAVEVLLKQRYGYKTTLLLNANRYQMLEALNQLRQHLTEEDNLLIYYGGHGELDQVNQRGHWLPVDATADSTTNWISNIQISDILNAMNSQHILIVADSCYSGTMTRSSLARLEAGITLEKRLKWIKAMLEKKSRTALTSGGIKPVLDSGGEQHSIFAKAFLESLEGNTQILEAYKLYQQVATLVNDAAARNFFEQIPEYAPIRHATHEAGEFFFMPIVIE